MEDMDDGTNDMLNQNQMKRELIQAILDERAEYETLSRQNEELQKKIILSDTIKAEQFSQPEVGGMQDHKYLNTLSNVHQVRFNLKDTQDRYNRMASELQAKLNEKQQKC